MSIADELPNYDNEGTKDKWDALYSIVKGKMGVYEIKELDLALMDIYKGDAYGLMKHLKIPSEAFYITMLINDMKTPTEFDLRHRMFKILNIDVYKGMKSVVDAD